MRRLDCVIFASSDMLQTPFVSPVSDWSNIVKIIKLHTREGSLQIVEFAQGARQDIMGNIACIWYGMHFFIKGLRPTCIYNCVVQHIK